MKSFLLCVLFLGPFLGLSVSAETPGVAAQTGADGWQETLPAEVTEILDELGIRATDTASLSKTDVLSFLSALRPSLTRAVRTPLKTGGVLLAAMLLCLLAGNLTGEQTADLTGKAGAAVCALLALSPLTDVMTRLSATGTTVAAMMRGYVPVCGGLAVACGKPAAASASSAFLLSVCALLETASEKWVLPFSGMLFALSAVTAADASPASAFAEGLLKVLKTVLGFLSMAAGGLFALQNGIAASSDSLSLRSAKFAVSGFVPLVGGMLSDALGTVTASASVLRSGVGFVGLLALLTLLIPMFSELFFWQMMFRLLSFFAGSCGGKRMERVLSRTSGVFSVLTAAFALTGALLLFASAVLVRTGGGT